MNAFLISIRNIKKTEKVLMILMILAIIGKHVFNIRETVDIFVFAFAIAIFYFPLGFYYLESSSKHRKIITSVLLGFVFSIGVLCILLGTLKITGQEYWLSIVTLFLIVSFIFLFYKLKFGKYPKEYVYPQFLRIIFILVANFIVLI